MAKGVIDRDRGWKRISNEIRLVKGSFANVGIQADAMHHDEDTGETLNTASIGVLQELGTRTIPRRPFMSRAFEENLNKLKSWGQRLLGLITSGKMSAFRALSIMGQMHTDQIKAKITDGPWIPNAPYTIRQKGSSKPLIDTGQMRQSVTYVVDMPEAPSK